ncbi:MAG: hypothetical protein ACXVRS_00085 [Gaiellaceae bacterium]
MDDRFADRMNELSEINAELLAQRWEAVEAVAAAAGRHEQAKLVLLSCRAVLDRDGDAWFWEPFREREPTFPVDNGVELHSRLAEACARNIIEGGGYLVAMLVKLAVISGLQPVSDDLDVAASEQLEELSVTVPSSPLPKAAWTSALQTEFTAEEPMDSVKLALGVSSLGTGAQAALAALSKQVGALTTWAKSAEERFGAEQRLVEWLIGGVRSDGVAWTSLPPGAAAIDAAAELAEYLVGSPQPRHEAILNQILAIAGVDDRPQDVTLDGVAVEFGSPGDDALAVLTPLIIGVANSEAPPRMTPYELAQRVLWEVTTTAKWNEAE